MRKQAPGAYEVHTLAGKPKVGSIPTSATVGGFMLPTTT